MCTRVGSADLLVVCGARFDLRGSSSVLCDFYVTSVMTSDVTAASEKHKNESL